jgi:hypothetical protein
MINGRVIRILDRRSVAINVGSDDGVEQGMRFGIYTPREHIVDPETNEDLGVYRRRKATIQASTVSAKFTIASPVPRRVRTGGGASFQSSLTALIGTYEEVEVDLPVSSSEIDPLPTGEQVAVGDTVEEIVTSPPVQPASAAVEERTAPEEEPRPPA